jgi:hypothetical protein
MANEISGARDGLKTLLENISGLRVYDHKPDSVNELPAAFVEFKGRSEALTLGGSSFVGRMTITVLLSKAKRGDGYDDLTKYIDPLGTQSIEVQLDSDTTWGGSVDDGRVRESGNLRELEIGGGRYVAVDFKCEFVKQMSTS